MTSDLTEHFQDPTETLELLKSAIDVSGYSGKISIGMDVAASEFFKEVGGKQVYDLDFKNPKNDGSKCVPTWALGRHAVKMFKSAIQISGDQLGQLYRDMIAKYPIVSIEDAFDQDDWDNWVKFLQSSNVQLVGWGVLWSERSAALIACNRRDDLTVTNPKRIQAAVDKKACNCLLLKVNQIGSVTESIKA